MMNLSTRLTRLELVLRRDDRPGLVVVFADEDNRLVHAAVEVIDPATLGPRTVLVVLSERPDGPA